MNFGKFDIVLLTTMSLAVILMAFAFPALGMVDDSHEVNESEVPEFNLSANTFDMAGDFPEVGQGAPTSGTLEYDQQRGGGVEGISLVWIDRPKDSGTSVQLVNDSTDGLQVWFRDFDDTGSLVAGDEYNVNSEGQTITHHNASWTIEFDVESLNNVQEPTMNASVDFNIRSTPDGAGGGFSFGGLEDIANVLAYIAVVITWGVTFIIEVALNIVIILFDISTFIIGLMHWLLSTYFSIVSGASGFASVILVVPGILLFGEFAKVAMIIIKLLPTT